MALIQFVCPKCGYECEELVKNDGNYPSCPKCGEKLKQKLSGKCYISSKSGGCSGNCSCCGGCGK